MSSAWAPNPHWDLEKQKGIAVAKMLVGQGVYVLLFKESLEGKGPSFVLADAGVETRPTEAGTLGEIVAEVCHRHGEG
jgi:predicted Fe-Mo cluster-binding NifX family protein